MWSASLRHKSIVTRTMAIPRKPVSGQAGQTLPIRTDNLHTQSSPARSLSLSPRLVEGKALGAPTSDQIQNSTELDSLHSHVDSLPESLRIGQPKRGSSAASSISETSRGATPVDASISKTQDVDWQSSGAPSTAPPPPPYVPSKF